MAKGKNGGTLRFLPTLLGGGVIGDLTDAQLLERFAGRDGEAAELAFTALVERHGPGVLRAGLAIVRDEHDAQDVFQATFLVLALKATGLRVRGSLAPWLHAVASRVALCDRSATARRRRHEREAAGRSAAHGDDPNPADWEGVLHEELGRLPDRFRQPIVLCDLGGATGEQAARQLGWPVGTVRSRLARGRDRLRARLTRRGLAPAVVLSVLLTVRSARASVPEALALATVRAALRIAAGQVPAGIVSAAIVTLLQGMTRRMFARTLRNVAITVSVPVGIALAYLAAPPGHRADGRPVLAAQPPEVPKTAVPTPAERVKPLLGTWVELDGGNPGQVVRRVSIKLLSADPALALALGSEAPVVCTYARERPGKDVWKPSALLFIDPSAEPPQITFQPMGVSGGDGDRPDGYFGIYRFSDEKLTFLMGDGVAARRPSSFEPEKDSQTFQILLRRVPGATTEPTKPGPAEASKKQ